MKKDRYILLTLHRAGLVDNKERMEKVMKGILKIIDELRLPIVFPAHPRTVKNLKEFGMYQDVSDRLIITQPLGYLEFLNLEDNARLIITDSGGVQEEAGILNVPCVTIRDNTEWIETVEAGKNVLAGYEPEKIIESVKLMIVKNLRKLESDVRSNSSIKIVDVILQRVC